MRARFFGLILGALAISSLPATAGQPVQVVAFGLPQHCEASVSSTAGSTWVPTLRIARSIPEVTTSIGEQPIVRFLPTSMMNDGPLGTLLYPYIFRDLAHLAAFLDSDLYAEFARRHAGAPAVSGAFTGTRQLLSVRPINDVTAIKGLRVRSTSMYWSHLGGASVTVPFFEVPIALERGVIDAVETSPGMMYRNLLPALANASSYSLTLIAPFFDVGHFIPSNALSRQLSGDQQRELYAWLRRAAKACSSASLAVTREAVAKMEAAGVRVVPSATGEFQAKAREFIAQSPVDSKPRPPWLLDAVASIAAIR